MLNEEHSEVFIVNKKNFTAVAVNVAAKAGEWIQSRLGEFRHLEFKASPQDLVTEVDQGSERLIRRLLQTYYPDHTFLGEEESSENLFQSSEEWAQSEYVWIIDPIDGTTNFVHGFPFYCVSLALAYQGEVIVGVVYDPTNDELFVAEKGKGAYVHGKRMRVSGEETIGESLIGTGFPADRARFLSQNLEGVQRLAPQVRNLRSAGSAALHLAYVAAGRLSGFWEYGLHSWDVAAGALLVQESGGQVTDTEGNPYNLTVRNIAATNGKIHQALIEQV